MPILFGMKAGSVKSGSVRSGRILPASFVVTLIALTAARQVSAVDLAPVSITAVESHAMEGPAHHGLLIETSGITEPTLTAYEVQIGPHPENDATPYEVYATDIRPFDSKGINIPYRNGTFALAADRDYCVRIRAIYGNRYSNWATSCGVRLTAAPAAAGDTDSDGLPDADEYAIGTDPNDPDSDRDGVNDGTEVANGDNPNDLPMFPHLIVRTPLIDFGQGDPLGGRPNQHQVLAIENVGDRIAHVTDVIVENDTGDGPSATFFRGSFTGDLSNIPPRNFLRIPVSFIPIRRGPDRATVRIVSDNPTSLPTVTLRGEGVEFPLCRVSPALLDFGTVSVDDQEVAVQEVMFSNVATEADVAAGEIPDAPFGFSVSSTVDGMAPGIRAFVLKVGESIRIPVLFQHREAGDTNGSLEIRSAHCGIQRIEFKGKAE